MPPQVMAGSPGGAAAAASWAQGASGPRRIQGEGSPCPGRGRGPMAGNTGALGPSDRPPPHEPCPSPHARWHLPGPPRSVQVAVQIKDYGQARQITLFEHGQVALQLLTSALG